MRRASLIWRISFVAVIGAAIPLSMATDQARGQSSTPKIVPKGTPPVAAHAGAACRSAMTKFINDAVANLQRPPTAQLQQVSATDLVVQLARTSAVCAPATSLRTTVCQHAMAVSVDTLTAAAKKSGDKPLTALEVETQIKTIVQNIDQCIAPTASTSDECRSALEVAQFDIAKLPRDNPDMNQSALATKAEAIRAAAQKTCEATLGTQSAMIKLLEGDAKQKIQQEVCAYKQRNIGDLLKAYYGRGIVEGSDGTMSAGRQLKIEKATFGDLRHGHTCDATRYFERRCTALQGEALPSSADDKEIAGTGFCLIRRSGDAEAGMRTDFCGFDPSPQADLRLKVEFSCDGEWQDAVKLPSDTAKINLVCDLPKQPPRLRLPDQTKLAAELKFFAADPCPIPIDAK